jgi:lipoprotein-releasing system permease protein
VKPASSIFFAFKLILPRRAASSGGRKSLFGAVACIALSLVPLVVVLTVSDGMISGITRRMIGLSSYHLRVYPPQDQGVPAELLRESAAVLAGVEGVTGAYPEKQGIGLAAGKGGRLGVTIRAVVPELFSANSDFSTLFSVTDGQLTLEGTNRALIGSKIAEDLGLRAGDSLRLITLRTGASGAPIPRSSLFTVAGVISSGYQELDSLWVFVSLDSGDLLQGASSLSFIGLTGGDPFSKKLALTAWELSSLLPREYTVYSWEELNAAWYENFASTKTMLLCIMILIVLVASVNISSALVILAIERRREIAILKSLGATSGGVSFAFLLAGISAGAAGVALGIPLGLLCAVNVNGIIGFMEKVVNLAAKFAYILAGPQGNFFIPLHLLDPAYYLEHIPVVLPFGSLFFIVCGTLVLSALAAVFPSIRAGREKPIDTLRRI